MINEELIIKMTEFNAGDPKRIQHFIKVYEFAHVIGMKEQLEEEQLRVLDMVAIMHDIGITTHIYEGERFDETFRADFPYCCDLASVLLASYLSVHVSDTAKAYITQNLPFNHSWCECEGEIIDYTYFQFDIEPEMKKRFKNYELEKEEFSNYILQKDIIWTGNSGHINTQVQFISVKELELVSKEIAKKYSFGKDDFLIYANEAYEMVELRLNNIEKISVS